MIPKVINQIYIGGELSSQEKKWRQTWIDLNPDWEVLLWTERELGGLIFRNEPAFKYCKSIASKVDIIRYELLYQFGGLYIDTDFECLKPITPFLKDREFVACKQNPNGPSVCNAFIACTPKHRVMHDIVYGIEKRCKTHGNKGCVEKFGPGYITDIIDKQYIFPSKYVYPFMWTNKHDPSDDLKIIYPEAYAAHHWNGSWTND